ncbi:recombinase family protein [Actinomadura madurae]|uniref:recombinase family protein n=1 Tax=Actinomadura madurae TaxID=1993 RepID=UPI00399BE78C
MTGKRRAVGGIRLSSMTEETTSPQRQKSLIQAWADGNNATMIGWATDLDVSASIEPWDRPELGPWLNRADEYDLLIFAKLDRAVRSLRDFVNLTAWSEDHKVGLVILDPPIDLTDLWGKAMAGVLAVFAELERGMIAKRTREGYEELLAKGRWPGGRVPYGYRAVKRPGVDGWWLVVNEEQAEVLRKIAGRIIGGASTLSQAKWLNEEKVPTARGAKSWGYTALYDMLRSPALMGQRLTADGDVVRDESGMPVQRADPILNRADWERLQAALDANAHNRTGNRQDAAPLLRVAFCYRCQRPLYRRGTKKKNAKGEKVPYFYYRCASANDTTVDICPDRPYRSRELEQIVFDEFLAEVGGVEIQREVYVPGEDHSEDLETAQAAYSDLTQQLTDEVNLRATEDHRATERPRRPYRGPGLDAQSASPVGVRRNRVDVRETLGRVERRRTRSAAQGSRRSGAGHETAGRHARRRDRPPAGPRRTCQTVGRRPRVGLT